MRALTVFLLACAACSTAGSSVAAPTPTPEPTPTATVTARPMATPAAGCEPTRTRDESGVITANGRIGIVGETFALGDLLNGGTAVVRRGANAGDSMSVRFEQIGSRAPATWVAYGVSAKQMATPWGDAAFKIGWKPIGFEDTCWRLIVDGADSGIVLAIGH